MRNFVLAKEYINGADLTDGQGLTDIAEGKLGVFYIKDNGKDEKHPELAKKGNEGQGEFTLVLGRSLENGGPVVLPLYRNHFTYVKGDYEAAKDFEAKITIPAPLLIGDYGIIIVKKGVPFNERNKWTAVFHVVDVNIGANGLAEKLAAIINQNTQGSGVKATAAEAEITITGLKKGVSYAVIGCDLLTSVNGKVSAGKEGTVGYGDVNYIMDLADKAAADAGFEYTYLDPSALLYPGYFKFNPLKAQDAEDKGFTIFTLRFAEPRKVKTTDEVVHQIIQVAFPKGGEDHSAEFETLLKGIAGEVAAE